MGGHNLSARATGNATGCRLVGVRMRAGHLPVLDSIKMRCSWFSSGWRLVKNGLPEYGGKRTKHGAVMRPEGHSRSEAPGLVRFLCPSDGEG